MPRTEEQEQQFALSYGPEDAFTLHRYHRPPRSSTELGGGSRPGVPAEALEPRDADEQTNPERRAA